MKNIIIFFLAILAVCIMLYIGFDGMSNHQKSGAFFTFVGTCTGIGLSIDISNHIKEKIRKSNLRKLMP